MGAIPGFVNQPLANQSDVNMRAASTASGGSTSAAGTGITSNDFLTLLVTELKNQDPTASSDPNAYVNQLVQVNSLEQLINISSTLNSRLKPASVSSPIAPSVSSPSEGARSDSTAAVKAHRVNSGNLSLPVDKPAGHRIASALSTSAGRL